jgi:CubicO group peptidase (beta-lactamase class C family)
MPWSRGLGFALVLVSALALGCARPKPPSGDPALAAIEQVLARWDVDEHPDLKAVVVRRRGAVVAERYYNGERSDTLHDVRSAGKSVTSLLIGIALDRGQIESTAARVGRYLPDAESSPVGRDSLDDLLTMRSGLAADDQDPSSPGNEDNLDAARAPVAFALAVPAREPPGSRYVYNSLTAYLAGLVLEKAVFGPQDEFARDALFAPLGITDWRWQRDAAGHTKGQGNLSLHARDFAKIGQMVLDRGTYNGRRSVSERWIEESLRPRVAIGAVDPYADGYGYFWYEKTHDIGGERVSVGFASGSGGNKIYVVPSRALVVAVTSSAYGRGYGQRRSEAILKALLAVIPPARAPS